MFDTLFIVNITEDLKHALSLCLMLSSFDPENYAEIIRSDRFPFASHLKQLYHMTLDSQHEVEIVVKTEKIVTNVNYIALNKEKISIEILNDGSYSKVKFKAIDNMKDKQLNPLRIVKIFFALISILKDNINYEVLDIHYPCGCSNVIKFEHDPSNLNFDSLSFYMDNSEIQKINEFLNAIYKDGINQIHFAIEKYMSSTERKSPYDKILDFVIAQEILLGKGDGVDSIKYKICNRLINCLTNDYNQRMLIYKKFSILYDIRSIIVHNTLKKEKDKQNFDICIKNLNNYNNIVKIVFRLFIDQVNISKNHDSILEMLDFDIKKIPQKDLSYFQWVE